MPYALVKPSLAYMPSYLTALAEGNYCPMQICFGMENIALIVKDQEGYIRDLRLSAPFNFLLRGKKYTVNRHELLWFVNKTDFVGTVAMRYDVSDDEVYAEHGHFGIAVRPKLVNQGCAYRALLRFKGDINKRFVDRGFESILLVCHDTNKASRRLIEKFGGVYVGQRKPLSRSSPAKSIYALSLEKN